MTGTNSSEAHNDDARMALRIIKFFHIAKKVIDAPWTYLANHFLKCFLTTLIATMRGSPFAL
jgi:hypothetical protein